MFEGEFAFKRDCDAVLVPDGNHVLIGAGTVGEIKQALGNYYTVLLEHGVMVSVHGSNAEALGIEASEAGEAAASALLTESELVEQAWEMMRQCYDPEIPVNIVDLGLVYGCRLTAQDGDRFIADVTMTLTAPGCGMGDVIATDVKDSVERLHQIAECNVVVVFEPAWNQDMMSDVALLELGLM
jgi:probable FeS assembly SUF system protein SufT